MTFQRKFAVLAVSLMVLLLGACASQVPGVPVTAETGTPGIPAGSPELPPEAVLNARQWLASQLNVAVDQVQIIEAEQAEWTDSCLGLGRPEESCLQVITPGWRAVLEVNGQRYEVRTDRSGSVIRVASPEGAPGLETGLENTHWNLVSFGSPGAEQALVEGSVITLVLAGGRAGGSGGCNAYGGAYQVEGSNISFEEITSTLRACADQRVTDQEQLYLAALGSASQYHVEGDQLLITYDDGNGRMVFAPALPSGPGGPIPTVETPSG